MSYAVTSLVQLPELGVYTTYTTGAEVLGRLQRREQAILLALVRHLDADPTSEPGRVAWPGVARLARMAGYQDRCARLALQELQDKGLIRRVRRVARSDRGRLVSQTSLTTVHPVVLAAATERRRLHLDGPLEWTGVPQEPAPRERRSCGHQPAKFAGNHPGVHTPPIETPKAGAAGRPRRAAESGLPAPKPPRTRAFGAGGVNGIGRARTPKKGLVPIDCTEELALGSSPAAPGTDGADGAHRQGGARGPIPSAATLTGPAQDGGQGGAGGESSDPAAEARQVLAWLAQHGVDGLEAQLARRGPTELGGTFQPRRLSRPVGLKSWQTAPEVALAAQAALSPVGSKPAELYTRVQPRVASRVVVLDDLKEPALTRLRILNCARVVVETSAGSHHVLLLLPEESPRLRRGAVERGGELDKAGRREAQARLAAELGGDPAATSGDRLWRLPGSVNHKRAPFVARLVECCAGAPVPREWLLAQRRDAVPGAVAGPVPAPMPEARDLGGSSQRAGVGARPAYAARPAGGADGSESGNDMRLAWRLARQGVARDEAARRIAQLAEARGKGDAARCAAYACRTVAKVRCWQS